MDVGRVGIDERQCPGYGGRSDQIDEIAGDFAGARFRMIPNQIDISGQCTVFERDDGVLNLVDLSVHAIVSERSKNTVSGFALGIR